MRQLGLTVLVEVCGNLTPLGVIVDVAELATRIGATVKANVVQDGVVYGEAEGRVAVSWIPSNGRTIDFLRSELTTLTHEEVEARLGICDAPV